MEEKKIMTHIVKGVLVSLILIVLGLIGYFAKMEDQAWFRWSTNLLLCGLIIWGCVYYANQMNNHVTFGNVFVHGFKMSVVIALILVVYTMLSVTILFPDMKDKALEVARKKMEDKGSLSDADIDKTIDMIKKYFTVVLIGALLLGTLFFGTISSLIGAAVAKKKPFNPLEQLDT